MTVRLRVDFNEVEDDRVWTSVRSMPFVAVDDLVSGDWVEVYDDDGASCWGQVVEINWPIVTFRLKWETWQSVSSEFEFPDRIFAGGASEVTSTPKRFTRAVG